MSALFFELRRIVVVADIPSLIVQSIKKAALGVTANKGFVGIGGPVINSYAIQPNDSLI